MSIGWTTINPALISVFTEIATDRNRLSEGFTAEWKEGSRGITSPEQGFSLLLKITNVAGYGEDEVRREMVSGKLIETIVGQRKFTLQVQIVCPDHTDERWAFAATERIRTRLRLSRFADALYAAEIAVQSIGRAVKATFKDRGRMVSAATMDIVFGTVASETDDIPNGWIDYVVLDSHYQETPGIDLPNPGVNYTDLEIPTIP